MLRLPAVVSALIVAVIVGWWSVSLIGAQRKLDAIGTLPERGDYRVTLDFAPERFHQLRLQEAGRLVEVRGSTVFLKDVAPRAIRSVAGEYWVDAIARWDGA